MMILLARFFLFFFMVRWVTCSYQTYVLEKVLECDKIQNKWEVPTIVNDNVAEEFHLEHDLIVNGLPGQPFTVNFRQYGGYVTIDKLKGRQLYYYFSEAVKEPTTAPLILWLNGGPGCSSFGIGALVEHGPFGVNPDGKTLYLRKHSWNQVANILYLESPAGVGFSYSNTTSDYNSTGDASTVRDSYIFLINWFRRFPQYVNVDFYIAGESYGGCYVPELADTIVHNMRTHPALFIRLKGVIVGNGIMDKLTDKQGYFDFMVSHALISRETYKDVTKHCILNITVECVEIQNKLTQEMGNIFLDNLYSEPCLPPYPTNKAKREGGVDPCEEEYVVTYLNKIEVQHALHVHQGAKPYAWTLCHLFPWRDGVDPISSIYRKLIAADIRVLIYSGDVDGIIPFTSTQYSVEAMKLDVKKPWRPWLDAAGKVGGYRVDYEGLTFATVRGAGHEVPRYKSHLALSMLTWFLKEE